MSTVKNTSEKANHLSVYEDNTPHVQVNEQDVAALKYNAPYLAADIISTHFTGEREDALVLDVACGTGLVTRVMKKDGFGQFVGIDGSEVMLEKARKSGLYQDLRQSMLGEGPLPFQMDTFDVAVIVGGLSHNHVPVAVVREMCKATKPGGYVCMTSRISQDNLEYKKALEIELKKMEDERLWSRVQVTNMEEFIKTMPKPEGRYDSGTVYLYKKTEVYGPLFTLRSRLSAR